MLQATRPSHGGFASRCKSFLWMLGGALRGAFRHGAWLALCLRPCDALFSITSQHKREEAESTLLTRLPGLVVSCLVLAAC